MSDFYNSEMEIYNIIVLSLIHIFTITKTIASLVGMAVAPFFGKIMAKKHMHAVWVGSLLGVTAVFTGCLLYTSRCV